VLKHVSINPNNRLKSLTHKTIYSWKMCPNQIIKKATHKRITTHGLLLIPVQCLREFHELV